MVHAYDCFSFKLNEKNFDDFDKYPQGRQNGLCMFVDIYLSFIGTIVVIHDHFSV